MDIRLGNAVTAAAGAKSAITFGAGSGAEAMVVGPCLFYSLFGINSTGTQLYVQIYDKASAPITNDVPIVNFSFLASGTNYAGGGLVPITGLYLANGLAFGLSTDKTKYAAGGASPTFYTFTFIYRN